MHRACPQVCALVRGVHITGNEGHDCLLNLGPVFGAGLQKLGALSHLEPQSVPPSDGVEFRRPGVTFRSFSHGIFLTGRPVAPRRQSVATRDSPEQIYLAIRWIGHDLLQPSTAAAEKIPINLRSEAMHLGRLS